MAADHLHSSHLHTRRYTHITLSQKHGTLFRCSLIHSSLSRPLPPYTPPALPPNRFHCRKKGNGSQDPSSFCVPDNTLSSLCAHSSCVACSLLFLAVPVTRGHNSNTMKEPDRSPPSSGSVTSALLSFALCLLCPCSHASFLFLLTRRLLLLAALR